MCRLLPVKLFVELLLAFLLPLLEVVESVANSIGGETGARSARACVAESNCIRCHVKISTSPHQVNGRRSRRLRPQFSARFPNSHRGAQLRAW
jgi:hypothetical protein